MQLNKFIKKAHEIVVKDRVHFDSLLQFEKTKKLQTKDRVNFTVDKVVITEFRRTCKAKGYNMSAKIEEAMKKINKNYF